MRFVPPELSYQRLRNSIRRLRQMGVDGNMLFLCACEMGMTPDAIGLVEDGLVDADVIVDRASRSGDAAQRTSVWPPRPHTLTMTSSARFVCSATASLTRTNGALPFRTSSSSAIMRARK